MTLTKILTKTDIYLYDSNRRKKIPTLRRRKYFIPTMPTTARCPSCEQVRASLCDIGVQISLLLRIKGNHPALDDI